MFTLGEDGHVVRTRVVLFGSQADDEAKTAKLYIQVEGKYPKLRTTHWLLVKTQNGWVARELNFRRLYPNGSPAARKP